MKAAVLRQRRAPLVVEELDIDDPGPGQVRLRIEASGICHSDLHHVRRDTWLQPPAVLGHEGAGVVESVGREVTRVGPGDRVIAAFGVQCGECYFCTRGQPCLCAEPLPEAKWLRKGSERVTAFMGVGSYATHANVDARSLVRIPDEMPIDRACLIACGVTTGLGAVINTARVEVGASVLVIGLGGVGLNAVQGARLAGAARIIAVDILDSKLDLACAFGATHVVNASREDTVERVRQLTGGRGADYAFEVIGHLATIEQAYEATRKGGLTVIVGMAPEDAELRLSPIAMMRGGKTLTACRYGSARPLLDFPRYVDLYLSGRLLLDELITRRYPLEELNEAFAAMEAGEIARGVVVF